MIGRDSGPCARAVFLLAARKPCSGLIGPRLPLSRPLMIPDTLFCLLLPLPGFTFLGVVVLVATPPMVLQTVMGIIFLAFAILKTSIDVSKTDLARFVCDSIGSRLIALILRRKDHWKWYFGY